ncbi:Uncharacterised protein [Starkeya nomas]|uniref:Transposase n=1 Tax=Starkeya nomas TaxID=2666134 RepID=A0A5S9R395_9HYPH|nr:transposase [Starkeya nomas]CAA0128673.1 Uncharacterised protein [Starkeya nomas]
MRRSRYTEDEILFFMAEADNGIAVEVICRAADISERTFYRWRERYGGLSAKAVHRLQRLEQENRALRRSLALVQPGVPRLAEAPKDAPRIRTDCGAIRTDSPTAVIPARDRGARGAIIGRYAALRTGR